MGSLSGGGGCLQDYQKFDSLKFEAVMGSRADTLLNSLSTLTLSGKIEQLSEAECQERIKYHQEKAQKLLEDAQRIYVCFLVDCTGSMGPWIATIKDNILIWKRRLLENYQHGQLHFSFVRYTDFDQSSTTQTTSLDFTEDPEAFTAFINGIEIGAGVGGDEAEDVLGGLKVAVEQLNWNSNVATKVLIHIADAPCHGQIYHGSDVGDSYPDGDLSIKLSDLLDGLCKKQIQYYFGYIKQQATEKMIAEFNGILSTFSGESCYIKQLDATNPESVEELVFNSLEESITKTLSFFGCIPKGLIEFDPHLPNWDDEVQSEKGIITPPVRPNLTENEVLLCLPSVMATVKRGAKPFAMGTCRYVYHGYIIDTNTHVVLKENKKDTHFKRYLENYHAHLTAMVYAEQFNREKPDTAEAIQFVSPSLLEIRENSGWRHFSVEPYIEGEYLKFNSNAGYVAESSKINDTLQAFSHYSWQKSGERLIVCDLQGVVTNSGGALLTDPSIHSRTEELLLYGPTNLGVEGIRTFFSHHTCNTVCKEMELRPYS